jgi:hypothetical protein
VYLLSRTGGIAALGFPQHENNRETKQLTPLVDIVAGEL